MRTLRLACIALALAAITGFAAAPKPGKAIAKYKYPYKVTKGTQTGFGRCVAEFQSGGYPLIGAGYDVREGIFGAGQVYAAYDAKNVLPLPNPPSDVAGNYGDYIAASGTKIAVGAITDNVDGFSNCGSVVLHDLNASATSPTIVILNPTPGSNEYFGDTLAMDNDLLAIGASGANDAGESVGSVYFYDTSSAELLTSLTLETSSTYVYFGVSAALTPNRIIIGASGDDDTSGSVYVYDRNTYQLLRKIPNPEAGLTSGFGNQLAVVGSSIAVQADGYPVQVESVYILDPETGALQRTIRNPTGSQIQEGFGWTMAGIGNRLLVGASQADTKKGSTGAAYLFDADTGDLLLSLAGKKGERFGQSVSGFGTNLLIGAPGASKGKGTAYLIQAP